MYIIVHSFISLKTKQKTIHRGEVLQTAVNKSDLSITQIARKAGYSRSSYYHHISDPLLSYEILEAYGKVISYDFTEDFPEMHKYMMQDPSEAYAQLTLEEAVKQRDLWKEKYIILLEKYNTLIEERIASSSKKKT